LNEAVNYSTGKPPFWIPFLMSHRTMEYFLFYKFAQSISEGKAAVTAAEKAAGSGRTNGLSRRRERSGMEKTGTTTPRGTTGGGKRSKAL